MRATFPAALSGHGVRKPTSTRPRINRRSSPRTGTVLLVRQQTRGVCDAASVLHGPSGSPGTKKSQTCVVTDLRRLSFADCDSCRSHNGQGKIRSAGRLGRPERRCPLIDLLRSDTSHARFDGYLKLVFHTLMAPLARWHAEARAECLIEM